MSHLTNQQKEEHAFEVFRSAVQDKDWASANQIFLDLQDQGLSHLEPKFIETLTDEECADYTRWRKANSDNS